MLAMAEIGVKPAHYGIFTVLDAEGPSPQTRLAAALQIDRGQLVGLIDELESGGLVLRERDLDDRRRQAITLTAAGRERLETARAALRAARGGAPRAARSRAARGAPRRAASPGGPRGGGPAVRRALRRYSSSGAGLRARLGATRGGSFGIFG